MEKLQDRLEDEIEESDPVCTPVENPVQGAPAAKHTQQKKKMVRITYNNMSSEVPLDASVLLLGDYRWQNQPPKQKSVPQRTRELVRCSLL